MRERTRTDIVLSTGTWTTTRREASGSSKVIGTGSYNSYGDGKYEFISDEPLPTLASAQRRGEFLIKPMRQVVYKLSDHKISGSGSVEVFHPTQGFQWAHDTVVTHPGVGLMYPTVRHDVIGWPNLAIPFVDDWGLQARLMWTLQRAYEKAAQADMLSYVSAAEAGKTLEQLRRLARTHQRLTRLYRRNNALPTMSRILRSTRPAHLWRHAGEAASLWLEWRYGVRQLYFDTMSLVKLSKQRSGTYAIFRASWDGSKSLVDPVVVPYESVDIRKEISVSAARRDQVRAGVIVAAEPLFGRRAGLDLPLTSAWELVPYSFLVDRVFNVAGMLAAWEGRYIRRPVASWYSTQMDYRRSYHEAWLAKSGRGGDGLLYQGRHSVVKTATEDLMVKERVANPRFYFPIMPEIRLRLDWGIVTDVVAMIRQSLH